jgi:hypothetical protein
MQQAVRDSEIEAFLHVEPIMAVIGTVLTFCVLWTFIVFILFRITRIVLLNIT